MFGFYVDIWPFLSCFNPYLLMLGLVLLLSKKGLLRERTGLLC